MLHVPQRTPSQLAAIEHRKKFAKNIQREAAKVIPIAKLCEAQVVPILTYNRSYDVFGPVVHVGLTEPIDADLSDDEAFGPIVRAPKIEEICRACCKHFGVTRAELLSHRRNRPMVRMRWVAMYIAKVVSDKSLPEIGRRMGNRDHTTVLHAVAQCEILRTTDTELEQSLQGVAKILQVKLRPAFKPQEAQNGNPNPA